MLEEIHGSSIAVTFGEKQHGDVRDTFADTHLAEQILGYQPRVTLREGLADEYAYVARLYEYAGQHGR